MDGILLFNKPILWTSHDAVDFLRRKLGQKSVGHAGTLDPMATGLLVMLVGKCTKLSADLSGLDKDYYGSLILGLATDTQDLEGKIITTADPSAVGQALLERTLGELTGAQTQAPPAYSAAKKDGKKMYQWARQGVAMQAKTRDITVKEFRLLRFTGPEATFFLTCSKGTYVRTLCDAVGRRLGCGATLSSLVRSRVGEFRLDDALDRAAIEDLSPAVIEKKMVAGRAASLR